MWICYCTRHSPGEKEGQTGKTLIYTLPSGNSQFSEEARGEHIQSKTTKWVHACLRQIILPHFQTTTSTCGSEHVLTSMTPFKHHLLLGGCADSRDLLRHRLRFGACADVRHPSGSLAVGTRWWLGACADVRHRLRHRLRFGACADVRHPSGSLAVGTHWWLGACADLRHRSG